MIMALRHSRPSVSMATPLIYFDRASGSLVIPTYVNFPHKAEQVVTHAAARTKFTRANFSREGAARADF